MKKCLFLGAGMEGGDNQIEKGRRGADGEFANKLTLFTKRKEDVMSAEIKTIIELDQNGQPIRVLVAKKDNGDPLFDLTEKGKTVEPKYHPKPGEPLPGHGPCKAVMAFVEGNCVIVNGIRYCL